MKWEKNNVISKVLISIASALAVSAIYAGVSSMIETKINAKNIEHNKEEIKRVDSSVQSISIEIRSELRDIKNILIKRSK